MQGRFQEGLQDSALLPTARYRQSDIGRHSPRSRVPDTGLNVPGEAHHSGGPLPEGRFSGATEGADIVPGQRRRSRRKESHD